MNPISILRILLIAATAVFVLYFVKDLLAHKEELKGKEYSYTFDFDEETIIYEQAAY